MNQDQERAIRAFLDDPAANPLHVTPEHSVDDEVTRLHFDLVQKQNDLQQRLHELTLKENRLEAQRQAQDAFEADLARREERTEDTYQTYKSWLGDLDKRRDTIEERERELNVQEKDLKVAGARLKRDGDAKKVSDKARTEALIQRFTTERDYRQAGEAYKPIVDDWKIEQRVQELAKLTARTKTVRTSMATLAREFKETLGDRETDDLMDADEVLFRIGNAAGVALKRARALEVKLKEAEKQRHQTAHKAATAYLQPLDDAGQTMVLCILYNSNYELGKFLGADPAYYKSMSERLAEVKKQTHDYVRNKIKDYLKQGWTLEKGLAHLDSEISQAMPTEQEAYGPRVERAIAAVVAERLTKANAQ
ncbi:hypothetical protein EZJ19_00850 [Parasulfuritortus cantonensis]|uniref:Uncharacterized protein n=1 Tax=Parasulfuritortus cantonensis TaxID=2528202 RepID=A0A4R1BQX9_9PROT|nr:hypothetical protein [Parasulfuritortus cantonensis]TCJ20153.1 hypothetical protein EZJ19_00850 [Parasulfuritortus cantonensis]